MNARQHVTLVGILHIAWSLLLLTGAGVAGLALLSGLLAVADDDASHFLVPLILLVFNILIITAGAGIIGAIGLFKYRNWGRYVLLTLGAIWLIKVPVGTALGIYTFFVLTRDEVVEEFVPPRAASA